MKRFLVTTAIKETWPEGEPILFLGEWCRLFSRKGEWSSIDAEVLPYHWNDLTKFNVDYQYLTETYEQFLGILSSQLNKIHGVEHDLRYWRILIGPWLCIFLAMLYDRWSSIQQAVNNHEISETIVLSGLEDDCIPNDMKHFSELMTGDEWNHHIYSMILKKFTQVSCVTKPYKVSEVPSKTNISFKHKIAAQYTKFASLFVRNTDAFVINTYLSIVNTLRLQLRFFQVPQIWRTVSPDKIPVDHHQREWVLSFQGKKQTDFETFALDLIPKQIPVLFLEGYRQLLKQMRELPWPKHPKLIFSSNVLWYDTVSTAYIAEKISEGTPMVYGQHGGHYWTAKLLWGESHEVAVSDRYLSWGFTDKDQPKIKPVGFIKKKLSFNRPNRLRTKLILVTLNNLRYSYSLYSGRKSSQILDYLNNLFLFVEALPSFLRDNILVRLTNYELGWDFFSRWRERFPWINLDPGNRQINDLIADARLVVCTYNATTFLENFASDIPTIIYWDPVVNPLRDSAIPYFEDLKRVGIFHETPESAALHVKAIWNEVDSWWNNPTVRKVLEEFKKCYCHQPDNLLDSVETALREAMVDVKTSQSKVKFLDQHERGD